MAEVTCLSYTFDTAFTDLDFDSFPLDLLSEVPTTLSTSPEHEAAGNMAAEANCGMDVDMTSMEPPSVQDSPVMTRSERSAPILRERSSADGTTLSSKTPAKDHALVIGTTQDTDPQPGMTTTPLPRSGSGHGPPQTYSVAREQADEAKGNDSAELLLDVDESLIQNRGRETTGSVKRIHELGEAALPQDPLAHVPIATPAPHHDDELEHTAEEGSSSEAILIGASALVPDGHGPEPSASAVMCSEAVAVASSPETTICKTFIVLAAPEEVTATSVEHVGSDGNTTMPHVTPEVTGPGKHGSLDVILTPMSRPPSTMNLRSTKRLAKGSQGESNVRPLVIDSDDEMLFDAVTAKDKRQKRRRIDSGLVNGDIVPSTPGKQRRTVRERPDLDKMVYNMAFHPIDDAIKGRTSRKKRAKESKLPSEPRRKLLELRDKVLDITQSYMEEFQSLVDQQNGLLDALGL